MRRLIDKKLTRLEAVAIQIQVEDEALAEWRERMAEIKQKEAEKHVKNRHWGISNRTVALSE